MTRAEEILKLIVEYFIKTAEPVGSKTLLEKYHLGYSSATIRAEMNALEKQGFLEKTHTSSGRVPSEKGYTYYVENLRKENIDDEVKYALAEILDNKTKSVEQVMKESCEILSNMTNLVSVVLGPKASEERLLSIQIIPLSEKSATAVFVTDQGYVENKTFIMPEKLSINELQKTVVLLNDRLKGTPISQLVPKMEALKPALTDYVVEHDVVYQAILTAFLRFAGERIELYGKGNLFENPEFVEDTKKLRKVLELIDDPEKMRSVLAKGKTTGEDGLNVSIGNEDDVAVLSATIDIPGHQSTSISLLGPRRMDYEKAMSMLEYVSKALEDYFDSDEKGEENGGKEKAS